MEENYLNLSKEELIERLKSKDEQIKDMRCKVDCMKADIEKRTIEFYEFEKLKNKNNVNESTIKELKETIVLMSVRAFGSEENMVNLFKDIDKNLNALNKTLCGNNKQGSTRKGW